MKRFIRTIQGKAALFMAVILFACVAAGCVAGACLLGEYGFYTDTKEEVFERFTSGKIWGEAGDIARDIVYTFEESGRKKKGVLENPGNRMDRTNLRYLMCDEDGNVVARMMEDGQDDDDWKYCYYYSVTREGGVINFIENYGSFRQPFTSSDRDIRSYLGIDEDENTEIYQMQVTLAEGLPVSDGYAFLDRLVDLGFILRYAVFPIAVLSVVLTAICFVALMCASARRPDTEVLYPGALNEVPIDLLAVGVGFLFPFAMWFFFGWARVSGIAAVVRLVFFCLMAVNLGLGLCMSIAARIKQKTLWSNTIIYRFIRSVIRLAKRCKHMLSGLFSNLPLIWKTALAFVGISILELMVMIVCWWEMDNYFLFWFLEKVVLVPAVLYAALVLRKLQKAGEALASGELDYQVDTGRMFGDFKAYGENLNSIADGMARAVEQRMKSERMKTELITNVSHDIKTPLTSIINYADLIGKEPAGNENTQKYAAVLMRQSERLKRLIEDLVEASKASTGNLEVELTPCEAEIFLTQISGEYQQKLKEANLELILKQPKTSLKVMADGRRMYRVFDNLMNNICKYAQSGTRVYLSLEKQGEEAVITFKNISRTVLDIGEDELMERFVRGDASRNTEGNGLGLSIARSLTELQKGKFELSIDGDLFKVTLRFPLVKEG